MKTIEELAQQANERVGIVTSNASAAEFLRAAFALRDAEAVPVGHVKFPHHRKAPDVDWAVNYPITKGAALYLHAPAPSDLVEENERLRREDFSEERVQNDSFKLALKVAAEQNEQLRQQLTESQSENDRLKDVAFQAQNAAIDLSKQLAESQAREKKLREALVDLRDEFTRTREWGCLPVVMMKVAATLAMPDDDTALREYVEKEVSAVQRKLKLRTGANQELFTCLQSANGKITELKAELAALKQQEPSGINWKHLVDWWKSGSENFEGFQEVVKKTFAEFTAPAADAIEQLQAELENLKQSNEFNFEQYQDAARLLYEVSEERDELAAQVAVLREALLWAADFVPPEVTSKYYSRIHDCTCPACSALVPTPADALTALKSKHLEEAAKVCEFVRDKEIKEAGGYITQEEAYAISTAEDCAAAIRILKFNFTHEK